MSVNFVEVVFRNNNGIDVNLAIEAPIGTLASGPQIVAGNSTVTVPMRLNNCISARIIAGDPDHGEFRQSFALASPVSGIPSYLESINIRYVIGTFYGSLKASTE